MTKFRRQGTNIAIRAIRIRGEYSHARAHRSSAAKTQSAAKSIRKKGGNVRACVVVVFFGVSIHTLHSDTTVSLR